MATCIGLSCGVIGILFICQQYYLWGAVFIAMNRLMDGLDGAIARASQPTDFGGFLDISVDFIVYSGVVFAFAWADPTKGFWAAFLIFSYVGPITTFLAYAIMAEKKLIQTNARGTKSFYYMGGLCEGTETAFVMMIMCVMPNQFSDICLLYAILCWITTAGRILQAWELSKA